MSLFSNIDHIASAPGVIAVAVDSPDRPRAIRGPEVWVPVIDAALRVFAQTGEDTIRVVIGEHTLIHQRERGDIVTVIIPIGHAVGKSLRRMIRRLAKRERAPLGALPPIHAPDPGPSGAEDGSEEQEAA